MVNALATFFKQVGVMPAGMKNNSNQLERCQSFVAKDKKVFPKFSKSKQKVRARNNTYFIQKNNNEEAGSGYVL